MSVACEVFMFNRVQEMQLQAIVQPRDFALRWGNPVQDPFGRPRPSNAVAARVAPCILPRRDKVLEQV